MSDDTEAHSHQNIQHNGETYIKLADAAVTFRHLRAEITRLRDLCDRQSTALSLSGMRHVRILVGLERRNARQRRALAKLYQRRNDKNAALATARRDGMEYAKTLVDLYAKGALKCKQCGDIRHDYYPDNCTGRTQYRESEEYKRRLIYDGEYSAMRYFEKHLCRPEMMDAEDAFKALAAAICAAAGEGK
ncbi:hypothetical protein UFOVP670_13 [uncultured Caudovirales phage]|uniref:Uncharacterized protein n=1 Tax=uncultured Caudovirales phage TaxID=2100421 RepID=A0A6J5NED3_9CAUD|nr:hypothetical protein UFOVP670_13 [uncultured Caudovirales phage]